MTMRTRREAASAAITALVSMVDDTDSLNPIDSQLIIYSGVRPTNLNDALSGQVVLVSFPWDGRFALDFQGKASLFSGSQDVAGAVAPAAALQSGQATFFRIVNGYYGQGAAQSPTSIIFDGDVSDSSGSGDLIISSTNVQQGVFVQLVSLSLTIPSAN